MGRSGPDRRRFLAGATASIGVVALSRGRAQAQAATRLRTYWWGAKDRADRTNKIDEMFAQANPGVTVSGETLGWGGYWTRLATQAAGRNMDDPGRVEDG